jgi:hypothetical protein
MPRQARLDAPDVLQHVMVRGIERTLIFRNTTDRADFVARVAALAERGAWSVLAWPANDRTTATDYTSRPSDPAPLSVKTLDEWARARKG